MSSLKFLFNSNEFLHFYDLEQHCMRINHDITSVITKTAGKRCTFQCQERSIHNSFLSYLGKQAWDSQTQPSPSEDSPENFNQHGFWYQCNTINPSYWPKTPHILNDMARAALNVVYIYANTFAYSTIKRNLLGYIFWQNFDSHVQLLLYTALWWKGCVASTRDCWNGEEIPLSTPL